MAVLICAAIALAYINKVDDYIDDHGGRLVIKDEQPTPVFEDDYEYSGKFDAGGSRGAAGWVLFVSCVGIFYHVNVVYLLVRCNEFDTEEHNTIYSVTVSLSTVHTSDAPIRVFADFQIN